jgi:hypothetical protein
VRDFLNDSWRKTLVGLKEDIQGDGAHRDCSSRRTCISRWMVRMH